MGLSVQDKQTKQLRPAVAGDIAVLCRYRNDIPLISAALSRWDIPCVSARPGLLSTPEATLVVACLRRLHDPSDTVATAAIVSLTESLSASAWLTDRLRFLQSGAPHGQWKTSGDEGHPLLQRLEALRTRLSALTPAEALRLAKAESNVCMLAAQWSSNQKEAAIRIANVEALLAMSTDYEDECRSAKRPATIAGLLQWLAERAATEKDTRAATAVGAVEVLTHHGAKGLEWPIVVMTGLSSAARTALWEVRARTEGAFQAQAPLAGRFIHYWPKPYGRRRPPAMTTAEASPLGREMEAQALDEHKRLLYVSFTRARDVLVMATHTRTGATAWTDEVDATSVLLGGEGDINLPGGQTVRRLARAYSAADIAAQPPRKTLAPRKWFVQQPVQVRQPLWLRPSAASDGRHSIAEVVAVGSRVALQSAVDMTALGSALHHCIAVYFADVTQPPTT